MTGTSARASATEKLQAIGIDGGAGEGSLTEAVASRLKSGMPGRFPLEGGRLIAVESDGRVHVVPAHAHCFS